MKKALMCIVASMLVACSNDSPEVRTSGVLSEAMKEPTPPLEIATPKPTTISGPCDSTEVSMDMTVNVAEQVLEDIKKCDPVGVYFELDGRIKDTEIGDDAWYPEDIGRGHIAMANMQSIAWELKPYYRLFEALPVTRRREIIESVGPKAAEFVVGYLNPEYVRQALLDLDWNRDIASINTDWWREVKWPNNRYEKIPIDGYGDVSKLELWTRMFWRRRGEVEFNTVKQLVGDAVATKKKGT
jgi:hypothetical protein